MSSADFTPERIAELRLTGEGLGGDIEIAWVLMLDAIEELQAVVSCECIVCRNSDPCVARDVSAADGDRSIQARYAQARWGAAGKPD